MVNSILPQQRSWSAFLAVGFLLILGSINAGRAQLLAETIAPVSLPLFSPNVDLGEGIYTRLPIRVSIFTAIGYDDNIYASHFDRRGSVFTTASLNIATHVGNERTSLDASISLGFDYYWDRNGRAIDPDIGFTLAFAHQFNPRTILNITSYTTYQAQPDLQLGTGPANQIGSYVYSSNRIALGYQWTPRFSTVTSYTANFFYYDSSNFGNSLNRLESIFGQEFRYLVLPTITAVGEYRFGYVSYFDNSDLDSYSHYLLGGADFTLSPRLTFGFRAGVEFRQFEGEGNPEIVYPYFESTLTYKYQPDSYLQWYSRYAIEESDVGTGYRKSFRTGFKISHAFGQRLRAIGAAYYSHNDYVRPSFTEDVLDLNIGVAYQFTRHLTASAGYTFERDFSSEILRDYYRNRVYVGLSYTF